MRDIGEATQPRDFVPSDPTAYGRMDRRHWSEDGGTTLNPSVLLKSLLACIAVLSGLGIAASYGAFPSVDGRAPPVYGVFLLDNEANLPTLFSFALLLFCATLLALIALTKDATADAYRFHWAFLGAVFFLMAFDEAASVHERLSNHIHGSLHTTGWLFYSWVIPALALVALMGIAYLRFLLALPKSYRALFLVAAFLYVGGAVGVEMPEGAYVQVNGTNDLTYQMYTVIEETMEMLGLALFAYALMLYLAAGRRSIRLAFRVH